MTLDLYVRLHVLWESEPIKVSSFENSLVLIRFNLEIIDEVIVEDLKLLNLYLSYCSYCVKDHLLIIWVDNHNILKFQLLISVMKELLLDIIVFELRLIKENVFQLIVLKLKYLVLLSYQQIELLWIVNLVHNLLALYD